MADASESGPKRRDDDCEMVTSLQMPALSKLEMYLHEAARRNHIDILSKILSKHSVNLDCRNQLDRTPLHMAVSHGNIDAVEMLIKAKASVDLPDKYGMTPLLWAAYFGHLGIVELLFDFKASIVRKNKQGMNVIHIAAETNNPELFEYVFSKKKNYKIDESEANGMTPIMIASAHGSAQIVDKLLERDCRADLEDTTHMTCLHHAVKGGHVEVMRRLVENTNLMKKKDVKDEGGRCALHYACELGHVGAVKTLLASQVDIDLVSNFRNREMHPLHLAAQNGHCEIIRLLIKANCHINAQNAHGNTALHEAALSDSVDACRTLLDCGIEIDIPNNRLQTALHAAVEQNKPDTVEVLLLSGSNTQLVDKTGKTPLLLATRGSYVSLVDMIIKAERYHERRKVLAAYAKRMQPQLSGIQPPSEQRSMTASFLSGGLPNFEEEGEDDEEGEDMVDGSRSVSGSVRLNGTLRSASTASPSIGSDSISLVMDEIHFGSIPDSGRGRSVSGAGSVVREHSAPNPSFSIHSGSTMRSVSLPRHPSRPPSITNSLPRSIASSRQSAASRRSAAESVIGMPADNSIVGLAAAPHLPLPEVDMSGTFKPFDYHNTYNIHAEESKNYLEDEGYRLKEFNQVYADEFKLFLWRISFKHLRHGEWKKLAQYWNFKNEHVAAIEHQYTGNLSYKQHGYRLLCIWFHGVDRNETPVRQLYEALVAIGRKEMADRLRLSLDAGMSRSGGGKCAIS